MNKETVVLIPVSVQEELPSIDKVYFASTDYLQTIERIYFLSGSFTIYNNKYVTHWYKRVPLSSLIEEHAKELVEALERISKWELPSTQKFWDEEKTKPISYEANFGSNGVREYIKNIAEQVLFKHKGE